MEMREAVAPDENKWNEEGEAPERSMAAPAHRPAPRCTQTAASHRLSPLFHLPATAVQMHHFSEKMRFDKGHYANAEKAVGAAAQPGDTSPCAPAATGFGGQGRSCGACAVNHEQLLPSFQQPHLSKRHSFGPLPAPSPPHHVHVGLQGRPSLKPAGRPSRARPAASCSNPPRP